MKLIQDKEFGGERPLFAASDFRLERVTITDGESGINVPIKDEKALAEAIEKICTDPDLHQFYAAGAKNRFEENFTIDGMIERTIKIYTDEKNR